MKKNKKLLVVWYGYDLGKHSYLFDEIKLDPSFKQKVIHDLLLKKIVAILKIPYNIPEWDCYKYIDKYIKYILKMKVDISWYEQNKIDFIKNMNEHSRGILSTATKIPDYIPPKQYNQYILKKWKVKVDESFNPNKFE